MNSTETPGGSGIPAGWYDDPNGQGLRWWDGEQWTEHVHTAESTAAATGEAGEGDREAPPPQLVKLRHSIQSKGAKGVGIVLGGLVLVIVVVALLLSGGSDDNSGKTAQPGGGSTSGQSAVLQQQIKTVRKQLKSANLPPAEKKSLEKQLKHLEKQAGVSKGSKNGKSGKNSKSNKKNNGKGEEATPSPSDKGR